MPVGRAEFIPLAVLLGTLDELDDILKRRQDKSQQLSGTLFLIAAGVLSWRGKWLLGAGALALAIALYYPCAALMESLVFH